MINLHYSNPLILRFSPGKGAIRQVDNRTFEIPASAKYNDFKNVLTNVGSNNDYVMAMFNGFSADDAQSFKDVNIKINTLIKTAESKNTPVFNRFNNQTYLLDRSMFQDAPTYAPSNEEVLDKFNQVDDAYKWQHQQADVWTRLSHAMPLSAKADKFNKDHLGLLTSANRGLEEKDLDGFFSLKAGHVIVPGLLENDMVGIPDINTKLHTDIKLFVDGKPVPSAPISMKTSTSAGYVIPMRNAKGDNPRFQIGTDESLFHASIKAKSVDGKTIETSELWDKNDERFYKGVAKLNLTDGSESLLHFEKYDNGVVTMADKFGSFDIKVKDDLKETLINRGYEVPEIIGKLTMSMNAKYTWPARGDMVGDEKTSKIVSPSNAGFVFAKEPQNGADSYVMVVVEGALKGHIAAKYVDSPDEHGNSLAQYLAGNDRGIIIAQVPGTAGSFIASASEILNHDYKIDGVYLAFDADGRTNKNVANGIHYAEKHFEKLLPVRVLQWDPDQKGLDDALLAVSRHEITLADMDLKRGSADELFPSSMAEKPIPILLDGSPKYADKNAKPEWILEDIQSNEIKNKRLHEAQEATREALDAYEAQDFVAGLDGLTVEREL